MRICPLLRVGVVLVKVHCEELWSHGERRGYSLVDCQLGSSGD